VGGRGMELISTTPGEISGTSFQEINNTKQEYLTGDLGIHYWDARCILLLYSSKRSFFPQAARNS
jgi:hypothetical protein